MHLAAAPANVEVIHIPEGRAGTRATLRIMSQLVKETRNNPIIRDTANDLTLHVQQQSFVGEIRECFNYVRDSIRYVQDNNGSERVQNPIVTLLQYRSGDCDDKCVLLAALLESIGHPCRFIACGFGNPGEFEHVFVETRVGQNWIPCDPTEFVDIGWSPLQDTPATCVMKEHI